MSTGISKNKWTDKTQIVTSKNYIAKDNNYELNYANKASKHKILNQLVKLDLTCLWNLSPQKITNNRLYFGDNLSILQHLRQKNVSQQELKLIYIDPPYGTNSVFKTRTNKESYQDILTGANYLEFLRERLILMRELLAEDGSIYVHLDDTMVFEAKVLMDEIFGQKNFRSFITRKKCSPKNYTKNKYGNVVDYILFYSKSNNYIWNRAYDKWDERRIKKEYSCIEPKTGKRFKKVPIHAPGERNGETGKAWKGMMPPIGKHWQFTPKKLDELDAKGEIYWSSNGNPRRKVYLENSKGIPVQNVWLEFRDGINQNIKITGYPTEKNPLLLERIIKASSNKGDLIMDCFSGSGTTLAVAKQLGRSWIGIDNSVEALDNILKRFIQGPKLMGDYVNKKKKTTKLNQSLTLFQENVNIDSFDNQLLDFSIFTDKANQHLIKDTIDKWKNIL